MKDLLMFACYHDIMKYSFVTISVFVRINMQFCDRLDYI